MTFWRSRLWWLIPFVAALAAIRVWWPELGDIAVLVTLACGLAYVVMRPRRPLPPVRGEPERDRRRPARPAPTARVTHYRTQKVRRYDPSHPPRAALPAWPRHVGFRRVPVGAVEQ